MKKSKLLSGVITFTVMAAATGMLAGCSGSAGNTTEETTASQEATTTATTTAQTTTTAAQAESGSYTVTDLLGREVEIPADADSFACIGAGALRYYTYVADKDKLAGIEQVETEWLSEGRPYSMALGDVSDLPIIGQGGPQGTANADALIAAEPDVIFSMYNTDPAAVEELQDKTGIPVVVLSYGKDAIFEDATYDSLELVGKITGNEDKAKEVVDYIKSLKEDLESRVADAPETPGCYLGALSFKGTKGINSTAGEYMPFDVLKVKNVAKEAGITGTQVDIDKEQIIDMDPDYIFLDAVGLSNVEQDYKENPDFYSYLKAFNDDNVYLQMPFKNYFNNIEVVIADAYYIGTVLYPEQFSDVDPGEKLDEISETILGVKCYDSFVESYGGFTKVHLGE